MVLVSLVDENRQWFKSRVGVDFTQTTRAVSFCAHAIVSLRPVIVRDATLDARFAANPLVMNAPYVRAYAGIPLFTGDGHAIGTLCAIDHKPREFDEQELQTLRDAAAVIQGMIYSMELAGHAAKIAMDKGERETLFRDTFEKAAVGIIHSSPSGELLRVNQHLCEMLGYTTQEMTGLSYLDISHPDDIETSSELLQSISSGAIDSYSIEKRYAKKDGTYLWTFLSVALKRTRLNKPDYFIAVVEDISERKKFEFELIQSREALSFELAQKTRKLQESNVALLTHVKKLLDSERRVQSTRQRLQDMANCLPVFMGYWNRDLVCEFANETYRDFFGLAPERIVGMHLSELLGADGFAEVEPHAVLALQGTTQVFERSVKRVDGQPMHLELRYSPDGDDMGEVAGFFTLGSDVTTSRNVQAALEAANAKLSNSSVTDYLTGIGNRVHFRKCGEEAAAAFGAKGEKYGVILVDVDHLQMVNDRHGHEGGDAVLRNVGVVLKNQLRNHRDAAARLVGGEFAMLCFGDLDAELLGLAAEEIRRQLAEEVHPGNARITASCGASISTSGDCDFKHVFSRAEQALRDAKSAGRNLVVMSDS